MLLKILLMLHECSFQGAVTHMRRSPRRHGFRYPLWMLYVDLDRIDQTALLRPRFLASVDRGHLLSSEDVYRELVKTNPEQAAATPMRIFALTQPRSLGASFNPVNFYFCFADGQLAALLLQVTNTPWGEHYCYALHTQSASNTQSFRFDKDFHVSPFLPMSGHYRLRLRMTDDAIKIAMRLNTGEGPLSACLTLHAKPLTRLEVLRGALRRPAQSALTLARIHWQAARLFLKRTPFHPHPAKL